MPTSNSLARRLCLSAVLAVSVATLVVRLELWAAEDATTVEARLSDAARYLSSDTLEGRGVGTKGLDLAADYLGERFREIGLKTDVYEGGPFQKFKLTTGSRLGQINRLALAGPASNAGGAGAEPTAAAGEHRELLLAEQFTPFALSGSGTFDLPLVFVGYGITGVDEKYDDYAGVDVNGKAVIILRHEPQQSNPHSVFDGTEISQHAPYRRKLSNAYEHGAAAVIFCTDEFEIRKSLEEARKRWRTAVDQLAEANEKFKALERPTTDDWQRHEQLVEKSIEQIQRQAERIQKAHDPLAPFEGPGPDAEGRSFPVLFCQRAVLDPVIKAATGSTLAELEAAIDKGPTPHSRELGGWRAVGEVSVVRQEAEVKNVVGVLEGEGPHANETIVLGAHYDHLGYGGQGSLALGSSEIHNGADDNGSGTSVLIEVARQLASRGKKLPRRLVFVAFTGEERGLVGSARYVRDPLFPLDSTIAMLNLDMVGRLQDEKLNIHGTGTATEFDALADRYAKTHGFAVTKDPSGFGPSDHSSFYSAKIPVLFFFTGSHRDYHRPSDDFEKLNIQGMRRICDMLVQVAVELASGTDRPHYQEVAAPAAADRGGDRPYFGSIPDFSEEQPGYALAGVTSGGPAERGGLKQGDIIIQFGESKIGNLEDFDSALRKYRAGDKVPVVVKRGSDQVKLEVVLDPPR